ncbi:hypothetical protein MMC12_008368, partial [Toensbergia leucococca]|nr:hypothetical protein [Toensbergia leucococca]
METESTSSNTTISSKVQSEDLNLNYTGFGRARKKNHLIPISSKEWCRRPRSLRIPDPGRTEQECKTRRTAHHTDAATRQSPEHICVGEEEKEEEEVVEEEGNRNTETPKDLQER